MVCCLMATSHFMNQPLHLHVEYINQITVFWTKSLLKWTKIFSCLVTKISYIFMETSFWNFVFESPYYNSSPKYAYFHLIFWNIFDGLIEVLPFDKTLLQLNLIITWPSITWLVNNWKSVINGRQEAKKKIPFFLQKYVAETWEYWPMGDALYIHHERHGF